VDPKVRLTGHFAEYEADTSKDCFDKCDADSKCAATCFFTKLDEMNEMNETISNCLVYKYGFNRTEANDSWTAYIKPDVEVEDPELLGQNFLTVKPNTRFAGHHECYNNFDALTPSLCFKQCKLSVMCGAASFTTDIEFFHNCFQFKRGTSFNSTEDLLPESKWVSFVKEKDSRSLFVKK
jgi:hypothetical protein